MGMSGPGVQGDKVGGLHGEIGVLESVDGEKDDLALGDIISRYCARVRGRPIAEGGGRSVRSGDKTS